MRPIDYIPPIVLAILLLLAVGLLYFMPASLAPVKEKCDTINRLVLDGKPYICHPMPEGTGHHD